MGQTAVCGTKTHLAVQEKETEDNPFQWAFCSLGRSSLVHSVGEARLSYRVNLHRLGIGL